jgi:uncharacterized protein DUF2017
MRRKITRDRDGSFRVGLSAEERELLQGLPSHVQELLGTDDRRLVRLFPPGYADDPDAEAEYRRLVGDGLLEAKRAALSELERTARAKRLTEQEAESWLGALESIRLVLGVQLDVTDDTYRVFDPSAPDALSLSVYHWLSWVQDELVQAMAEAIPSRGE